MKWKGFIVGLCIGLFFMQGKAQTYNVHLGQWTNVYLEAGENIVVREDTVEVFTDRKMSGWGRWGAWRFIISDTGSFSDSLSFSIDSVWPTFYGYDAIDRSPEGYYSVPGRYNEITSSDTNDYDFRRGLAMVMTPQWDTLWLRLTGTDEQQDLYSESIFCANGDLLFTGESWIGSGDKDVVVSRFSPIGDLLWIRRIDVSDHSYDKAYSAVETSNGDFIIGGLRAETLSGPADNLLLKLSADGEVLDIVTDGYTDFSLGFCMLQPLSDGNYLYIARDRSEDDCCYDAVKIVKINEDLSELWRESYTLFSDKTELMSIRECQDGSLVGVGSGKDSNHQDWGYLAKFSSEGDLLWTRSYQQADSVFFLNRLYDIELMSDGGYVASGMTLEVPWGQQIWLLRVDSMGCVVPGCDTLVSVLEATDRPVAFEAYPNPFTSELNVYLATLSPRPEGVFTLHDLSGKEVYRFRAGQSGSTYILQTEQLPPGMYLLRYTDTTTQVTRKVVKR
jgi:hypothetical protein